MCNKPTPHPHAEIIKAWADGIPIQVKSASAGWYNIDPPSERICVPEFNKNWEYRIKPQSSDFERYGVEVGDVWITHQGESLTVAKKIPSGLITVARGVCIDSERLKTLLFRRGEVNKL